MVKNLPSVERSTKIRFGKHVPDSNDQEENTIVFNASNVTVPTPYSNAVYLSPIRNRTDYTAPEIVLLMYDRNTKEITESGESANALIGGVTLDIAANRSNATSNVIQFTGSPESFVTSGNVGIANTLASHTLSVGSNLYIDEFGSNVLVVSGNVAILRDMVVEGNLQVNGDTTVIYTENTSIKDAFIELGKDNTSGDTTLDLGVLMHRPDALSNVVVGYREGTDEFAIAYTDAQPTDKTFTPKTDEDINVHVYGLTHVDANIYAHEDVLVTGNVYVSTNVSVTEELTVSGNVYADKDLEVVGNAYVSGNVVASKDLTLTGNAYVSGNISVTDQLTATGNVYADKDLELAGNAYVTGNVVASKDLTLAGNAYVTGNVVASKDLTLSGNAYVSGNVNVTKQLSVTGNAYVSGNVEVTKALIVSANTHLKGDNVFITHTMDFLDPKTAIVTDQVSNVQIRLGQLENVSNLASNPIADQVLLYDGNQWMNTFPNHSFLTIKNAETTATMTSGNVVYISGYQNENLALVKLAKADSTATMPAIGVVYGDDIAPAAEGLAVAYGKVNQMNTNGYNVGDTLYVSNIYAGWVSNVKPYYTDSQPNLIQNVGVVTRKDTSHGAMFVTGIGRSNDIPNATVKTSNASVNYVYVNSVNNDLLKIDPMKLPTKLQPLTHVVNTGNTAANAVTLRGVSITSGDGFHGDLTVAGNVTVDTNTFKVDAEANRVGILTASPGQTLDVRGAANVGALTTTSASVTDTTHSTSKDTGVLIVTNGGLGVEANIHSTNVFAASHIAVGTSATSNTLDIRGTANVGALVATSTHISDSTAATSTSTGALKVTGGAGIQGDLYANDGHFSTDVSVGSLTGSYLPYADNGNKILKDSLISMEEGGVVKIAANVEIVGNIVVTGNTFNITANDITITDRIIDIANNNPSHELDIGILMEHPGYNIGIIHHGTHPHHLSLGYTSEGPGTDHVDWKTDSHITANVWGHLITQNTVTVEYNDVYIVGGGLGIGIGDRSGDNKPDANIHVVGNVYVTSNISTSSNVLIMGDEASTSKTSGALQVTGGAGIQGDLYGGAATFDSLTVDTSTLKVDATNDYVGVKTATPNSTLHVSGNTYITSNLQVGEVAILYVDNETSNVGIGKTNPGFTLDVDGDINFSGTFYEGGVEFVSSPWTIETVPDALSYTAGNVGIGAANPDSTLHVTGNTYVSSNLQVGEVANLYVDTENTYVGIAKSNPGFTLDVEGDINFSGSLYEGGSLFVSTPWTIDGDDLEYTAGNIGIGTNAAAATLHVHGNIYSSSNISAYEIEVANVTTTNLIMDTITVSAITSLDNAINVSNITSNTVQFTNSDVGVVATGNVVANYFKGDGSKLTGIATTLQSVSDFGNTTSNVIQFTNATTGITTTSNVVVGGTVKQSGIPAFTVRLTDGSVTGPGVIDYNQVDTDNTSSYTTSDGRFTAPIAGHYFFSAHGIFQNDDTIYDFTVNGTRQNINSLCSAPSANYLQCNISAVLNLSVGDYVSVYQVEGGTFGEDNNVFTGFFIG